MRDYRITTALGLPIVTAVITGPNASKRVQLIFDSGAFMTQINKKTLTTLGVSFSGRTPDLSVKGVTGPKEDGYLVNVFRVFALGVRFQDMVIGAFDFTDWVEQGVDGLLGWALIRQFHFEMDGPNQNLKVF